eukprot:scaffold69_cov198-Alexandrium_tamarense.AAC.56
MDKSGKECPSSTMPLLSVLSSHNRRLLFLTEERQQTVQHDQHTRLPRKGSGPNHGDSQDVSWIL